MMKGIRSRYWIASSSTPRLRYVKTGLPRQSATANATKKATPQNVELTRFAAYFGCKPHVAVRRNSVGTGGLDDVLVNLIERQKDFWSR